MDTAPAAAAREARGIVAFFERTGEALLRWFALSGSAFYLLANTLAGLSQLRAGRFFYFRRTFVQQLYFTAVQAFWLAITVGAALGLLAALPLLSFGATDIALHAKIVNVVLFHQLVPFLITLIVIGRSGTPITAELGGMQSNRAIDSLLAMGIEPHRFLVLPRMAAMVVALVVLIFWADIGAVLGAGLWNVLHENGSLAVFVEECAAAMSPSDFGFTLLMIVAYGAAVALVQCQIGLRSQSDTEIQRNLPVAFVRSLLLVIVITVLFALARND